jgi:AAA15 family ATPase/GTPase
MIIDVGATIMSEKVFDKISERIDSFHSKIEFLIDAEMRIDAIFNILINDEEEIEEVDSVEDDEEVVAATFEIESTKEPTINLPKTETFYHD